MPITETWQIFLVAIGWAALWTNVVVVPFCFRSEELQKDYVSSGNLDIAISYIESSKLIPALAAMFEKARQSQSDQRRRIDMEGMLQAVDFLPDLESVEAALQEKKIIEDTFDRLQNTAELLWKVCLLHVISVIALPTYWYFKSSLPFYPDVWIIVLLFVAMGSLIIVIRALFQFGAKRKQFLQMLKTNR